MQRKEAFLITIKRSILKGILFEQCKLTDEKALEPLLTFSNIIALKGCLCEDP